MRTGAFLSRQLRESDGLMFFSRSWSMRCPQPLCESKAMGADDVWMLCSGGCTARMSPAEDLRMRGEMSVPGVDAQNLRFPGGMSLSPPPFSCLHSIPEGPLRWNLAEPRADCQMSTVSVWQPRSGRGICMHSCVYALLVRSSRFLQLLPGGRNTPAPPHLPGLPSGTGNSADVW